MTGEIEITENKPMTKTKKCTYKSESTQFSLWLREIPELCSSKGFVATDIDFMWSNYKTDEWMLIEEKRYNGAMSMCQRRLLEKIDSACKDDPTYKGMHLLVFERTTPDDGRIYWDNQEISKKDLIDILRFGYK
jgi:hypothetical protein